MRTRTVLSLVVLSMLLSCNHPGAPVVEKQGKKYAKISFTAKKIDIGNVVLGTTRQIKFYAVNRSNVPLVIASVKSSCSCTVSEFPKTPIMSNDSGLILAKYTPNSTNVGFIEKSIVLSSNTKPAFSVLTFTGNVVKKQ